MGPTGQSSQMSMQDQHDRLASVIAEAPRLAGVVDQFDIGDKVADAQWVIRRGGVGGHGFGGHSSLVASAEHSAHPKTQEILDDHP